MIGAVTGAAGDNSLFFLGIREPDRAPDANGFMRSEPARPGRGSRRRYSGDSISARASSSSASTILAAVP
jgi:hypothetical protein